MRTITYTAVPIAITVCVVSYVASYILIEFTKVVGSKLTPVRLLTSLASYKALYEKVPPQEISKLLLQVIRIQQCLK